MSCVHTINVNIVKAIKNDRQRLQLLVSIELSVGQFDLLPWFECWHAEIRAAGTSESITKVTLSGNKFKQT